VEDTIEIAVVMIKGGLSKSHIDVMG